MNNTDQIAAEALMMKAIHEMLRFPDGSEIMFATHFGADEAAKKINSIIQAAIEKVIALYEHERQRNKDVRPRAVHASEPKQLHTKYHQICPQCGLMTVQQDDTKRIDCLEQAYEIRRSKRGWAVLMQFTNYEYDLYPTLRQAIDAAMRKEK